MKHVFVVNPISGSGRYREALDLIHTYGEEYHLDYEVHLTEYKNHAQTIASQYQADTRIYAVGGDGTAHEVLNGLQPGVEMALIPVGSGNDFWRMIGNKDDALETIITQLIEGKAQPIDIGEANGERFLNCLNMGLDAIVNVQVNHIRTRLIPRKIIYLLSALVQVVKDFRQTVTITTADETWSQAIVLTSLMNGKWYGGGFKSAPKAQIADGLLDLCVVDSIPRRQIFPLIAVYHQGKHEGYDIIRSEQVKKVIFSSENEITYGCDGEVFTAKKIVAQVLPDAVSFVIPDAGIYSGIS